MSFCPFRRAEQHDGPRRHQAEPLGQLRLRQRQNDLPLDQLLLPDHAAQLIPGAGPHHAPAELAEYPGVARVHRLQPLIENHPAARGVPSVLQRQGADLALLREQTWIRCAPAATSRRSSSPSIALPIPRCRHAAARLIRITHARSLATIAAATPTSSSPTTAATAGSCDRTAAIRSDRPKAGASLLAAGLSHNRTAASRSSA